jgi:hypothetical protein
MCVSDPRRLHLITDDPNARLDRLETLSKVEMMVVTLLAVTNAIPNLLKSWFLFVAKFDHRKAQSTPVNMEVCCLDDYRG